MTQKEKFDARVAKMKSESGLIRVHLSPAPGADTDSEEFWAEVNKLQDLIESGKYEPLIFDDASPGLKELLQKAQ